MHDYQFLSHGHLFLYYFFLDLIADKQQEAFSGASIDWMVEWYKTKHVLRCNTGCSDSDTDQNEDLNPATNV